MFLPMDQSEDVHRMRLDYLRDAAFLGRRARKLSMEFAAVDIERSALAYVQVRFEWGEGGGIHGTVQLTGMPVTAVAKSLWVSSLWARCALMCAVQALLRSGVHEATTWPSSRSDANILCRCDAF